VLYLCIVASRFIHHRKETTMEWLLFLLLEINVLLCFGLACACRLIARMLESVYYYYSSDDDLWSTLNLLWRLLW
jgi:hypothetical protein